MKSYIHV